MIFVSDVGEFLLELRPNPGTVVCGLRRHGTAPLLARKGRLMRNITAPVLAGAMLLAGSLTGTLALAQAPKGGKPEGKPLEKDSYQRSLETYEFKKAAQSG